jgi:hypothetical protein
MSLPGRGVGPRPYNPSGALPPIFPRPVFRLKFGGMDGRDPPDKERRGSARSPPRYTPDQVNDLTISRVHLRDRYLFCLLSDGRMLCVPLDISPVLAGAPLRLRYQWQITEGGKEVIWYLKGMGVAPVRLNLPELLAHPEAQVAELPR